MSRIVVPDNLREAYKVLTTMANEGFYENEKFCGKLLLGNALETIKDINNLDNLKFDAVFLDPFSPKKAPEMWNTDFFREIKKSMAKEGELATYSCARVVKKSFLEAGFKIKEGPIVGPRRNGGVIAYL
jgi:tRNA U34 5-methylaminomethyl-2-thiouridine-forming methyltransferase MnmC